VYDPICSSYHPSSLSCGLAISPHFFEAGVNMGRNVSIPPLGKTHGHALSRETAIHEAGHAVAIYLGNKQKQLPTVFFQIVINRASTSHNSAFSGDARTQNGWIAKIENGRLIHTLPTSMTEATKNFSVVQKQAYQRSFEADIVNLLAGSLSEAKYVALRDNEPITRHLVPVQALHYYGGTSDLVLIREYLECFVNEKTQQADKIAELFLRAYRFINHRSNWQVIMALADYIHSSGKARIEYEEVGFFMNHHIEKARQAR
jgi:hypothetical protein